SPALPSPAPRTDGFAVAALVAGLCGTGPLAVGLGAAGLHRTAGGRAAGRGLAVAGLALGGLQTLAALVLVGLLAAGTFGVLTRGVVDGWALAGSGVEDEGGVLLQEDPAAGQCLLEDGADGDLDVSTTDCARPHDAEVVTVLTVAAGPGGYPGDGPVEEDAEERCGTAVGEALAAAGLPAEGFDVGHYTPSAASWAEGDRETVCLLHPWLDEDGGGALTGSLAAGDVATTGTGRGTAV
ncbi:DUF4190 domain-containing protein, partial [Kineococcus indalonis]|uniref:DUF4190 domain-containing protein n=1 Tax=Kineococcus indalonis TaxID=2696566 RepID=UPI00196A97FE